jgi:hypothetical protein
MNAEFETPGAKKHTNGDNGRSWFGITLLIIITIVVVTIALRVFNVL